MNLHLPDPLFGLLQLAIHRAAAVFVALSSEVCVAAEDWVDSVETPLFPTATLAEKSPDDTEAALTIFCSRNGAEPPLSHDPSHKTTSLQRDSHVCPYFRDDRSDSPLDRE